MTRQPSGLEPERIPGTRLFQVGGALAFLVSFVVYYTTMAVSSSFWDAGEFIASAYRLGVPHSPGTPLYVIVGRVFTLLPLPWLEIAQKVNLLSAFCGAAGILFAYILIVRFLDATMGKSESLPDTLVKVAGGLAGALFLAFSDTYWTNAIEAEVYAMSSALMGFVTWLALKWSDRPDAPRSTFLIYLLFYLLALSVGFHMGTVLAFSGIFLLILLTKNRTFSWFEFIVACMAVAIFMADATLYRDGRITVVLLFILGALLLALYSRKKPFALICTGLFFLGLSVHLYLKIRSGHNPSIDEGDPETWRALYAVLRREQYPPSNMFARKADFLWQLQHFNGYFQAQYALSKTYISALNLGAVLPIGLGIWGMVDQFARDRKRFIMMIVTFIVVSFGLVVFLNFSDSEVRERDYFYSPAFYYFAIFIGIGAGSLLGEIRNLGGRKSKALSPLLVGFSALAVAVPFFTMKHHYYTHDRSEDFTTPAYARNMLVGLEENAIIFTNGDNDTFPLWYIQDVEGYRTDVKVVNLSLLNTPWYIEQCRDNEPKVPISFTDRDIAELRPQVTREGWLLVRDLAVRDILRTNFQRPAEQRVPIYFSVTIPPETYAAYERYLEMEGLVKRVVTKEGDNMVNVTRLKRNLTENYKYTSILDENYRRNPTTHLPTHTIHLIQNYSVAFIQAAWISHQDSLFDEAVFYMQGAYEISPQMQMPRQMLGMFYFDAGDTAKAFEFYRERLKEDPFDYTMKYRMAGLHEMMGQMPEALALLDDVIAAAPEDRELMRTGYFVALRAGRVDRARGILTDWLRRNPGDAEIRNTLSELERQMIGDPRSSSPEGN